MLIVDDAPVVQVSTGMLLVDEKASKELSVSSRDKLNGQVLDIWKKGQQFHQFLVSSHQTFKVFEACFVQPLLCSPR